MSDAVVAWSKAPSLLLWSGKRGCQQGPLLGSCLTSKTQVFKEPFGVKCSLNHKWNRLCVPNPYKHYYRLFLLSSGVHVQVTSSYVRLYGDLLLNRMTVQMATELSVAGHLLASYLFVFFHRYCIKVQLCFSQWYQKTSILQWTSCKDVSKLCEEVLLSSPRLVYLHTSVLLGLTGLISQSQLTPKQK